MQAQKVKHTIQLNGLKFSHFGNSVKEKKLTKVAAMPIEIIIICLKLFDKR